MVTINLLEVSCCVTEFNQDFDLRQELVNNVRADRILVLSFIGCQLSSHVFRIK